MDDSQLNGSERPVQGKFSIGLWLGLLLLPVLLLSAARLFDQFPSRMPLPDRTASVLFQSIEVPGTSGAWAVSVDDSRFGGVSALALQGRRLLALTDSGVLFSLPRPGDGEVARVHDLPDGPGPPHRRRFRDSEALLQDGEGKWWVTFENRHSLWRFDPDFRRAEFQLPLEGEGWSVNKGVEALIADTEGRTVLIPEMKNRILRVGRGGIERASLQRVPGQISDAVRLPDGRVLVLVRRLGLTGIGNWIGSLEEGKSGAASVQLHQAIAVGPLTNLEAIAAEPLPSGATRLWIMSDNDFSDWRRTILLAIDLPAARNVQSPA